MVFPASKRIKLTASVADNDVVTVPKKETIVAAMKMIDDEASKTAQGDKRKRGDGAGAFAADDDGAKYVTNVDDDDDDDDDDDGGGDDDVANGLPADKSLASKKKKLKPDSSLELKIGRISLSSCDESSDLPHSDSAAASPNLTNRLRKLKKRRFFRRFENVFNRASVANCPELEPDVVVGGELDKDAIVRMSDGDDNDYNNNENVADGPRSNVVTNDVFMGYVPNNTLNTF